MKKTINDIERKLAIGFPAVLKKNEFLFGNLFDIVN